MALSWIKLFTLCCLLAVPSYGIASIAAPASWDLNAQEVRHFERGKVVNRTTTEEDYVKTVNAFLVVNAPAETVFSVITDYPKLHEFMPNLEHVDVLESTKSGAIVNYLLSLPLGVEKRYRLQLEYELKSEELIMFWHLLPWPELEASETIVSTSGFWHMRKTATAGATLLHYRTTTNPGDVPFGFGWLVDHLTKLTVVELLENTKERAENQWITSQQLQH